MSLEHERRMTEDVKEAEEGLENRLSPELIKILEEQKKDVAVDAGNEVGIKITREEVESIMKTGPHSEEPSKDE